MAANCFLIVAVWQPCPRSLKKKPRITSISPISRGGRPCPQGASGLRARLTAQEGTEDSHPSVNIV